MMPEGQGINLEVLPPSVMPITNIINVVFKIRLCDSCIQPGKDPDAFVQMGNLGFGHSVMPSDSPRGPSLVTGFSPGKCIPNPA